MTELSLPRRVVKCFGTLQKMEAATGIKFQTISAWCTRNGNIPEWRDHQIIAGAERSGVTLPADFLARTAQQRQPQPPKTEEK